MGGVLLVASGLEGGELAADGLGDGGGSAHKHGGGGEGQDGGQHAVVGGGNADLLENAAAGAELLHKT